MTPSEIAGVATAGAALLTLAAAAYTASGGLLIAGLLLGAAAMRIDW